jgi:hypothetical protein
MKDNVYMHDARRCTSSRLPVGSSKGVDYQANSEMYYTLRSIDTDDDPMPPILKLAIGSQEPVGSE